MDDTPEVIRNRMEITRSALSDKLEQLEQEVIDTVHDAKAAVSNTVDKVKDAFDIRLQVKRNPWAMLAGSIAVGYIGARLLERMEPDRPRHLEGAPSPNYIPPMHREPPATGEFDEDSVLHQLAIQFEPEIQRIKGLAIGTTLGIVRDLLADALPEPMKPQVAEVVDSITVKLGGDPIRGPVLSTGGGNNGVSNPSEMGRPMGSTQRPSQAALGTTNG